MKFLYNAPAIFHKGAVIVGDTHFGMEAKLRRRGIFDNQFSLRLFDRLKSLINQHRAKKLILLGDVKEDITMLNRTSSEILSRLSLLTEVIIVRGNHDGGIEKDGSAKIEDAQGFVYEGLGLAHGHSWPADQLMKCKYLVCGHQHPLITMSDTLGARHSEPVWLVADCNEDKLLERYPDANKKLKLVLIPAYNPLVGSQINHVEKTHLGPILNNNLFKLDDALVFRLDGTSLGKLTRIE
jgi:putative SbcD/Mre11-related phosphoesterase